MLGEETGGGGSGPNLGGGGGGGESWSSSDGWSEDEWLEDGRSGEIGCVNGLMVVNVVEYGEVIDGYLG